jgi:hypothetical protein
LRLLAPAGPKYVYASPQFWTPFHADPHTDFMSYAEAQPLDDGDDEHPVTLAGAASDRPIVLLLDELQWLPELTVGVSQPTTSWQRNWVKFIERHCMLEAEALGTAHGTIAAYWCSLSGRPQRNRGVRVVGGASEFSIAQPVLSQTAEDLVRWTKYDDARRTPPAQPSVELTPEGVRISGTGWPGIVKMFDATPGDRYLVRTNDSMTRDGDLLYVGTWQQPEVRSLSGGSSSGIPAPLIPQRWFPRDRAFVATAPQVRVLVYSEAPSTDFMISSLAIYRLQPLPSASQRPGLE